ncbi:MAG: hypothetical protein OXF68_02485 [Gammaproteobacteria bacterium]|nr:hypothetical protein [Gammaproteobacteria bacterium]
MPKLKPGTITPTPQEEERIRAGIDADPDAFELDAQWFKRARPVRDAHPHIVERYLRLREQPEVRKPSKAETDKTVSRKRRRRASPAP